MCCGVEVGVRVLPISTGAPVELEGLEEASLKALGQMLTLSQQGSLRTPASPSVHHGRRPVMGLSGALGPGNLRVTTG